MGVDLVVFLHFPECTRYQFFKLLVILWEFCSLILWHQDFFFDNYLFQFPMLECTRCSAVYDKVEEFLVHTLKQHFGEEHIKLYEELGLIHKDVQKVLDEARSNYYPVVGRYAT